MFESCENLVIRHCCTKQIFGLASLKGSLKVLDVDGSVSSLSALFDLGDLDIDETPPWAALSRLNITNATIENIDDAVKVFPNLENLNLHGNCLKNTQNLDNLLRLTILDLSQNSLGKGYKILVSVVHIVRYCRICRQMTLNRQANNLFFQGLSSMN